MVPLELMKPWIMAGSSMKSSKATLPSQAGGPPKQRKGDSFESDEDEKGKKEEGRGGRG